LTRAAAAALLLCACTAFDPEVGPQLAARCVDADGDEGAPVTYAADIRPLFMRRCFFCHSPTGSNPIGIEVGGLDLSTYDRLRAGGVISGARIVVPGSPCSSVLLEKLRESPSFGGRMPLNGPPWLEDQDIQLVSDWIAEGARVE
jgi:hypothetical protein